MRQVHIYDVDGKAYASAAEVVPAVLTKKPYQAIYHGAAGLPCVTCAVWKAVDRAIESLRYSLVKNIQASLFALALLVLFGWPLVYNAIPMPEITLAARIASGACAALSLIAGVAAGVQMRRLTRCADIAKIQIIYRYDGLLPTATAWRQSTRRAAFPWLGLGLVLFSLALNCVVVANYAYPAVLSDGTVRHSTSLAPPWIAWETGIRYFEDNFFIGYSYDEVADEFYVLNVTYRVENVDQTTPPLPGWKTWLISLCNRVVFYAAEQMPNELPAGATDSEIRLALIELFEDNTYRSSFMDAVELKWTERYGSDLKLAYLNYELLVATRAEAVQDYERHKD